MPPKKGYKHTEEARANMAAGQRKRVKKVSCPPDWSYNRAWKLINRFGITPEQHDEMLKDQNGGCAICSAEPVDKMLSVDHDHKTGDVRGLLCQPCNLALGVLEEHLESALEYLGGDDISQI